MDVATATGEFHPVEHSGGGGGRSFSVVSELAGALASSGLADPPLSATQRDTLDRLALQLVDAAPLQLRDLSAFKDCSTAAEKGAAGVGGLPAAGARCAGRRVRRIRAGPDMLPPPLPARPCARALNVTPRPTVPPTGNLDSLARRWVRWPACWLVCPSACLPAARRLACAA